MAEGEISVFGGFPVSAGIDQVCDALRAGFPEARVQFLDLGQELGPTLYFRTGNAFFSTLFLPEEDNFLFDGAVQGSLDEAIAFVRRLSECLSDADLEHDFHVARGVMDYAASFVYPPDDRKHN
jgi:hypothetical protein